MISKEGQFNYQSLKVQNSWTAQFLGICFWSVKGNYVIEITLMLTPLISYWSNFVGYGESVRTPLYPTKPRLAIRERNSLITVIQDKINVHYFLQLMSIGLAWKSISKSNEKFINHKYETLLLSWTPFKGQSISERLFDVLTFPKD